MMNNIEQVKAREGIVIAVATEGDTERRREGRPHVCLRPRTLAAADAGPRPRFPLQLFSYEVAVRRGCDVDQPRNLAKTVTVE